MDSSRETVSLEERYESLTDEYQADIDYTFEESDKEELTLIQRLKTLTPCAKSSIAFCPKCRLQFHNTLRTPLLLPACGHTICYPCIQNLRKIEMNLICAVCLTEVAAKTQNLPINFALLELLEKDCSKCDKHNLEFAGYCKVHSKLLCGACVLEHKKCEMCLLSENELKEIVQRVKDEEESTLRDLRGWNASWVEGKNDFLQIKGLVEREIEGHVVGLMKIGKGMIQVANSRARGKERKLNQCLNELEEAIEKVNDQIMENTEEILEVQNKLFRFDELQIVQKLAVGDFEEKVRSVDMRPVLEVHERVFSGFDYEQ